MLAHSILCGMIHKPGNKYGELTYTRTVGHKTYPSGQRAAMWELLCSCGKVCLAPNRQVTSGIKQSCGHLKQHLGSKRMEMLGALGNGRVERLESYEE